MDKLWISLCITVLAISALPVGALAGGGDGIDVVLLAPVPDGRPQFVAAATEGIEIRSIAVAGLDRLDESVVITGLTIKTGDVLVGNATKKLNDAAEALYNTGWFRAKPELSLDSLGEGAVLRVTVEENPVYKGARITGNTLYSTERLLEELEGRVDAEGRRSGARLVKGEVVSARKLVDAIDAILTVYQDDGYIGAGVGNYSIVTAGEDEGMVLVMLSEGTIDEVLISGLDKTRESIVRSQITHLQPGMILKRPDVERDLNQIYNTGLFESVVPNLEPSLKEGHIRVVIQVEEAPTGQAGFGLGYSTVNGLQGSVSYSERNLFGRGKQIGTTITFSNSKPGFEVSYTDPYGHGRSFWGIGLYSISDRQQGDPGTPYESELDIDKLGANVFWGQKLNDYDSYQLSFGFADYDYRIRKGDPFAGYDPWQRARLSAEGQTRKLGLAYSHDTRDNVFNTTQGFLGKATGELAGFGGDFSFNKWTLETREFFKLGIGSLGLRQQLGLATGDVPIYEHYRRGGVMSIRGISEDQIRGTHSVLSNIEYRVPITEMFGAVAFLDSGWAGDAFSDMDTAAGAGIGLRVKIPALGLGAVRLDYGIELYGDDATDQFGNDKRNKKFHFFLGEMF